MSTNEELVKLIQEGRADLETELWERVQRFCASRAKFAFKRLNGQFGVSIEDLEQSAFIAFKTALKSYSVESEKAFIGWLTYYLQSEWAELCGYRTSRRDMLNYCSSIDEPIIDGEGNETPVVELVPDSVYYIEAVEQRIYNKELHEALEQVLNAIPESEAVVLRKHYYEERSLSDIAEASGVSCETISARKRRGLRNMRQQANTRKGLSLRAFLNEENLYRGTGLQSFRSRGASSVEAAILRWERESKR